MEGQGTWEGHAGTWEEKRAQQGDGRAEGA